MHMKIHGLATQADYRFFNGDCPYTQVILREEYSLLQEYPDIRSVHQITAKSSIYNTQHITTSPQPKVLIHGCYEIQLQYTACGGENPVHSYTMQQPFQIFITVPAAYTQCLPNTQCVFLENLTFEQVHGRKFRLYLLVFAFLP